MLQNNPPNIQQIEMAGYPPPNFHGYPNEDPEEFIDSFRSYLVAVEINVLARHAHRVRAHGLFETCLKGDAKDWYERSLRRKNWELRNLLDNTGQATLALAQGQTAVQLGANLRHGAVGQAGNIVIPAHTVFDEDWSFADGRPTDRLPNAPNANAGQTIVADGIRLGQAIYWLKTNYPTITAEKQRMLFGSTVQGSDSVGRFYSKLRKLARLAGIDEQQIRLQFIRGISPDNQLEIRRIGINRPVSELLTELEEIERYKTEQLSGAYLYLDTDKSYRKDNNPSGLGITKTEIENMIKSMIPSIQEMKTQHFVPSQPISSQPSQSYYRPQPPGTSQIIQDTNMSRFIQWLTGETPEFVPVPKPDLPPKPAIKEALRSNNPQGN